MYIQQFRLKSKLNISCNLNLAYKGHQLVCAENMKNLGDVSQKGVISDICENTIVKNNNDSYKEEN